MTEFPLLDLFGFTAFVFLHLCPASPAKEYFASNIVMLGARQQCYWPTAARGDHAAMSSCLVDLT